METIKQDKHMGPHIGMLAIIFTFLFLAGLSFVVSFTPGNPHYPNPSDTAETIATYFRNNPHAALMCAFLHFGAAIPLGLYVVNVVSRLRFLGVKAAGPYIALFGGLMLAINLGLSSLVLWVMSYPNMAQDTSVIRSLYYIGFAIGGVGYSVPLGIFFAGVSVTAGFAKLLPKWLVWFGLILALCGELSWLSLIFPNLLFLIPLTRFPGFIWLIIVGFMLPKTIGYNESKVPV
ncbi:MAG TPA: hypothetical protein VN958_02420 [Chitinophagaceae bacterium]|nr:hypothetical protein [Chitinophagaceae bacterium]